MTLRHAAVVAGLALALGSQAVKASTFKTDISVSGNYLESGAVIGSYTLDYSVLSYSYKDEPYSRDAIDISINFPRKLNLTSYYSYNTSYPLRLNYLDKIGGQNRYGLSSELYVDNLFVPKKSPITYFPGIAGQNIHIPQSYLLESNLSEIVSPGDALEDEQSYNFSATGINHRRLGNFYVYYTDKFGIAGTLDLELQLSAFSVKNVPYGVPTPVLSPVPLPASAPMFGAAVLGLAGLGYAARRKKATETI